MTGHFPHKMIFFGGAALLLIGRVGMANPILCETYSVRQTPQSVHLQITYATDCSDVAEVLSIKRDGALLEPEWVSFNSFRTNTGSGIRALKSVQMCDCNVPLGAHDYIITPKNEYGDVFSPSLVVVSAEEAAVPKSDIDDTDTYENPWDIPEPTAIQGLDCIDVCESGASADAGLGDTEEPVSTDSAGADTSESATATEDTDTGADSATETDGDAPDDSDVDTAASTDVSDTGTDIAGPIDSEGSVETVSTDSQGEADSAESQADTGTGAGAEEPASDKPSSGSGCSVSGAIGQDASFPSLLLFGFAAFIFKCVRRRATR